MISLVRKLRNFLVFRLVESIYNGSAEKSLLSADVKRWRECLPSDPHSSLGQLYLAHEEFRNLFFYRMGISNLSTALLRVLCPPMQTLYLRTSGIGEGLFIQHGFSTIISARRIGKNCWINQQVTIGYSGKDNCPTLGDDVTIKAGAIVIGDITIGDRSIVGAGAVVVKSVPPDCTVVGNPAYIVRRGRVRVNEKLGGDVSGG